MKLFGNGVRPGEMLLGNSLLQQILSSSILKLMIIRGILIYGEYRKEYIEKIL
jgi:hypothetical protein